MPSLDRPIFLVGAARSGTTMLGRILAKHSAVAHWEEPNNIWACRTKRKEDDIRDGSEATAGVKQYIEKRFSKFVQDQGKSRFSEKTPNNCFRIPFMYKLFPEAKFLYLTRNRQAVILSAYKRWTAPTDYLTLWKRLVRGEVLTWRNFLDGVRKGLTRNAGIWGPRFPGIVETTREAGIEIACMLQRDMSISYVEAGLHALPRKSWYTVKFEDLVLSPAEVLPRILDFVELADEAQSLRAFAESYVDPSVLVVSRV